MIECTWEVPTRSGSQDPSPGKVSARSLSRTTRASSRAAAEPVVRWILTRGPSMRASPWTNPWQAMYSSPSDSRRARSQPSTGDHRSKTHSTLRSAVSAASPSPRKAARA